MACCLLEVQEASRSHSLGEAFCPTQRGQDREDLSCRFICGRGLLKLPGLAFIPSAKRTQKLGFQTAVHLLFLYPRIASPPLKVSGPPINQGLSACTAMHVVCHKGTIPTYICKDKTLSLPFTQPSSCCYTPCIHPASVSLSLWLFPAVLWTTTSSFIRPIPKTG